MSAKRKTEKRQRSNEILGVCICALGLFIGVSMYFGSGGTIGSSINDFIFGIWGLLGYAVPVVILISGIIVIACSTKRVPVGKFSLAISILLLLQTIMQIAYYGNITGADFLKYLTDSFAFSLVEHNGGGLLGAVLTYPMVLLFGNVGSIIFLCALILILAMILTKISIRRTSQAVGQKIKTTLDTSSARRAERKRLYDERLEEINNKKQKAFDAELDFFPSEGAISPKAQHKDNEAMLLFEDNNDAFDSEYDIEEPLAHQTDLKPIATRKAAAASVNAAGPMQQHISSIPRTYQLPPLDLLSKPTPKRPGTDSQSAKSDLLINTLKSFGIDAKVIDISAGPVITRFELQPAPGVRVNRITNLADDIALALAAPRVRIEAPIPGKSAIGIEIPNRSAAMVTLREILQSNDFQGQESNLTVALGRDISGRIMVTDLSKMPHLLIAGATGSGKSVCVNDIIISMLYKSTPAQVRLILIDPKVVELSSFAQIPHLGYPVITDAKKAAVALQGAVSEMEQRYRDFARVSVRNIAGYNDVMAKKDEPCMPQMVVIIDELADLMMVSSNDVETAICRIAQMGRAAGIHLIVATQRPSTDVITGLIKANIPSRIAFAVSSQTDSRIILDTGGAEKLLGKGDMLFHPSGSDKPTRIQGAFVSDSEIDRVAQFWKSQIDETMPDSFTDNYSNYIQANTASQDEAGGTNTMYDDELLPTAVEIVIDNGQASISLLQRRLRVGYARAARLVDMMEQQNIISGFEGSKPRRVLITRSDLPRLFPESSQDN